MKLFGKIVSTRLGSEFTDNRERADIRLESENGGPYCGAAPGLITLVKERGWQLGDPVELNIAITKIAGARAAAASAGKT